ncbi:AbrB family transcriptional regulator [Nocardioides fonticola]|uniref:AbrB family transcriptional regulator n=1 Tax=Nocardioides fonticola TaxID=450363 RepID=A0ABP7Y1P6_9ACTN
MSGASEEGSHVRSARAAALLVVAVTAVSSVVLSIAGLPSAVLFGGLIGGMAHALTSPTELGVPRPVYRIAQGVIGVTIGCVVSVPALRAMGQDAVAIGLVTLGTVVVSVAAGRLLALRDDVSPITGAFALIAGGASGVVTVARELGADDRVVTVVQYLRVLIVLVSLPLVTSTIFHPPDGVGRLEVAADPVGSVVVTVVAVVVGLAIASRIPIPTATLLAPLVLAAIAAAGGWFGPLAVPDLIQAPALALVGAQVGLRFTRASLRSIVRMLPAVLAIIVGMVVASGAMAAALAAFTPVDGLTAYLATTPGGLFAVLATAADSGSDVTYVLAVQLFRLLVVLALTPLLARLLSARPDR